MSELAAAQQSTITVASISCDDSTVNMSELAAAQQSTITVASINCDDSTVNIVFIVTVIHSPLNLSGVRAISLVLSSFGFRLSNIYIS